MNERKTLTIDRRTPEERCDEWLHTFPAFKDYVLMAVGIVHQIKVEYDKAQTLKFPFMAVRKQLKGRTQKHWYKELILHTGGMRYNLDGSEYGYQEPLPDLRKEREEAARKKELALANSSEGP